MSIQIAYKWLSMAFQPFLVILIQIATWELLHVEEYMNVMSKLRYVAHPEKKTLFIFLEACIIAQNLQIPWFVKMNGTMKIVDNLRIQSIKTMVANI